MRNKYEINHSLRIEEEPSSLEETLQVRSASQHTTPTMSWDQHTRRQNIIDQLFKSDQKLWPQLLGSWPNPDVKKAVSIYGVSKAKSDSILVGRRSNGFIHGFGLLIVSRDRFFEGVFQNNCKHGQGYQAMGNTVYIGSYINNKAEGKGELYSKNGDYYNGQFVAGMKHGYGQWISSKESYIGQWRSDKPDGTGVIENAVSRYEGQIRNGIKHGQGKEVFKNGDIYIGGYVNGRPEGYGEYNWHQNGSVFQGSFKNGLRHGKGIWTSSNGDRYEGEYLNDKKSGKGEFRWNSGNVYSGEYFNDLRHGQGYMQWVDGSWYKGQWKYGIQHGNGQLSQTGHDVKKGTFQNNVLVSQVTAVTNGQKINPMILQRSTVGDLPRPLYKLPYINKEDEKRRISMSLAEKKYRSVQDNKQIQRAATQYLNRSMKEAIQLRKRSSGKSLKRKTERSMVARDMDFEMDLIQWSNIYNLTPDVKKHSSGKNH